MSSAEGPQPPPPIVVVLNMPAPQVDGATGSILLNAAASYGWNAFIALNWPAVSTPDVRGVPASDKPFGEPGATPVWETMRSKVEVFAGNATASVGPHGATIDPTTHKATNPPDYGYGQPPEYLYAPSASGDQIPPCASQAPVKTPAWITLDETTEINNNQTFAGIVPAHDAKRFNSKPQLIRYAVKMNEPIYAYVVDGQYWYSGTGSPLATAEQNYVAALAAGGKSNPTGTYVDYAPPFAGKIDPSKFGIETKSAWRPLTAKEAASGRFFKTTVRYYEQNAQNESCYREAVWGLVGMHMISFATSAPWVIWSSFEQADNILTKDGKPTEDADGRPILQSNDGPTTPALSSDPSQLHPTVQKTGGYCTDPGARLFFRENPNYKTMPADGDICVNARWHVISAPIVAANVQAHQAIRDYLKAHNEKSSPWLYYKLVAEQGVPVDYDARNGGNFSTTQSYYSANATIETDYSLGNFTGDLKKGVPSDVVPGIPKPLPYYNTRLLPFQSNRLDFSKLRMGGCSGCHGFAASVGQDFSFALGNNVTHPEATDAFKGPNLLRTYFPPD